jgi:hypothetical protein
MLQLPLNKLYGLMDYLSLRLEPGVNKEGVITILNIICDNKIGKIINSISPLAVCILEYK